VRITSIALLSTSTCTGYVCPQRFQFGDVEITKVVEWQGEIAPARRIIPGSPHSLWQENRSWLAPDHWHPDTDAYHGAVQTWVLRSEGKTILIDTGVGNDRDRPQVPSFDHLQSGYLDQLTEAGVTPGDVDLVINTHIHYDHVGWNTWLRDGQWVPAFPNATYLIPRADKEYFDPRNAHRRRAPRDDAERRRWDATPLVYGDSIVPVLGQAVLWEDEYRIDGSLALEPGYSSCFCEDPRAAADTRRRVLERAADTGELVVPAHFAGASAATVSRDGNRFAIGRWAG
jgi:glyoxylase-like metal-dependent hydrolase (beta-lactamase superfamily II)